MHIIFFSRNLLSLLIVCVFAWTPPLAARDMDEQFKAMEWRAIGPFIGGRGTSVVGHPTDPVVFWSGHSSGGLWKTEDAGAYWMPVGEGQFRYGSVGAVAVYEKNPDVMYVGLGEPNIRQSVSWGDGMYKSTDGGETWQHIGLETLKQIARIRIHPDNPDVVFVATPGHAFGPSEDRGVFRTTDGGKTWEKVLYKNECTGAIDLVMSPGDPDTLFAALWEFERKAWGAKTGGADSGIWRSTDGGDSWEEKVVDITTGFVASMVATGRTLVQIISEPTRPMSKLVTLHNIMEHTEGPPNEPWMKVYEKTAVEIDAAISSFNASLDNEMAALNP